MTRLLYKEVLPLNADCVEFCPTPGWESFMAVGTYQLEASSQTRRGQLRLYDLPTLLGGMAHVPESTVDIAGVFDAKWLMHDAPSISLALADGHVALHSCQQGGKLSEQCRSQVGQCMCLALDWSCWGQGRKQAAVSTDKGQLALLQNTGSDLRLVSSWDAHDLEAWTVAFDLHQADVMYSGADDCRFKCWDVRKDGNEACAGAVFSNAKAHSAGVTCISSHPQCRHLLLTGSYDDHVRLWDTRNTSSPLVVHQVNTGGGVWRLKFHPSDPTLLLAACMYNGFAILQCHPQSDSALEVVECYKGHSSIAYGADWFRGNIQSSWLQKGTSRKDLELAWKEDRDGGEQDGCGEAGNGVRCMVGTCSFYDSLLHVWEPETRAHSSGA